MPGTGSQAEGRVKTSEEDLLSTEERQKQSVQRAHEETLEQVRGERGGGTKCLWTGATEGTGTRRRWMCT